MEKHTVSKLSRRNLLGLLAILIAVAVIIEAAISLFVLDRDLRQSTSLFLNQVESILQANEVSESLQLEELKETYMTAAEAAAYIYADRPELESDVVELKNIAKLLNVDELHIFDESGTIVGGSNPEYYGFSFDSGDQMAYFKPMLTDKTLSMCQDVTPNTAEGKSMMYAITWDKEGDHMIQVGVEPTRLLEMLQEHEISNVINSIPLTEGYHIYAIDTTKDVIVASTNDDMLNQSMADSVHPWYLRTKGGTGREYELFAGNFYFIQYRYLGDYVIAITYNLKYSNNSLLVPLLIIMLYLTIAGLAILFLIARAHKLEVRKNQDIMEQYRILSSMAEAYYSMHLIDLEHDTSVEYYSQGEVKKIVNRNTEARAMMQRIMESVTIESYLENALEFTDLTTVAERLEGRKIISGEFIGKHIGWFRASFITVEKNDEGKPTKVIYTTRSIDEDKKREAKLIRNSTTDELTGCLNRRAYEEAIQTLEQEGMDEKLVYLSVDVNGLKVVNDSIGHSAGDELILGATQALKKIFSTMGKIYRIGGDEFVGLIQADKSRLKECLDALRTETGNWHGTQVKQLSLSCGYAAAADHPDTSVRELALLADQRMYEDKSRHYRRKGMDRRGQQDAHKALCALYTKILKVDLTADTYQIVNMDVLEQTPDKGYSGSFSQWITGFGTSGQVHPEDLDEYLEKTNSRYLSDYFAEYQAPLHIFYRRKQEDGYHRVMMEIIPAEDGTQDHQNLYLYVKNID